MKPRCMVIVLTLRILPKAAGLALKMLRDLPFAREKITTRTKSKSLQSTVHPLFLNIMWLS